MSLPYVQGEQRIQEKEGSSCTCYRSLWITARAHLYPWNQEAQPPGELAGPFYIQTLWRCTEVSILAAFQLNKIANTAVFRNYKTASILTYSKPPLLEGLSKCKNNHHTIFLPIQQMTLSNASFTEATLDAIMNQHVSLSKSVSSNRAFLPLAEWS